MMSQIMKLEDKCKNLSACLNNSKIELQQQETLFNMEKSSLELKFDSMERNYKSHIQEISQLNEKLQCELTKTTEEKNHLSSSLQQNSISKDEYKLQIDELLNMKNILETENFQLQKKLSKRKFEENVLANERLFDLLEKLKILEKTNEGLSSSIKTKEDEVLLKDKEIGKYKDKIPIVEKEAKVNLMNFKK